MNLVEFIEQVGDEKAAEMWGVEVRTAASWRRRERYPRPEHAGVIVSTSPVTYEGIYGPPAESAEEQPAPDHLRRTTDKAATG